MRDFGPASAETVPAVPKCSSGHSHHLTRISAESIRSWVAPGAYPLAHPIAYRPRLEHGVGNKSAMTATESAPALQQIEGLSLVVPPIATSGFEVRARAARSPCNADGGVGAFFRNCREDRAECHIVDGFGLGGAHLIRVVGGEADGQRNSTSGQPRPKCKRAVILPRCALWISESKPCRNA